MRSLSRPATCLILTILPVACGSDDRTDGETYTVVDSAGIQIVESVAPAWGKDGRRIDPSPLLRIGRQDGTEAYQFGSVRHAQLLADGGVAVAAGLAKEIRIFDGAGEHVRTSGRAGDGPGEFQTLAGLWTYRGDSIAAFDQRLYRTTVLPVSSEPGRMLGNPFQGNFVVFGLLEDGPFLFYNPGERLRDPPEGLHWDSTDVMAMNLRGDSSWTVARLPARE